MREAWIVIAVLMCVVSAAVMAVPAVGAFRRFRRRRGLLEAFRHAVEDDQLRGRIRRDKEIFGDGFIDGVSGSAGTLRFRLTRRFRPFQALDAYRLELDDEGFDYRLDTSKEQGHVVVRAYLRLRWTDETAPRSEAS